MAALRLIEALVFWVYLLCLSRSNAAKKKSNAVQTLTDATWDDKINGIWMIKFYAPWCGHCKQYAPIFAETAEITQQTHSYIQFGEVDCDDNGITCSDNRVSGYPTTLLLFNGKLIGNYRESRNNAKKIKQWIIQNLEPAHLRDAELLNEEEIEMIQQMKKPGYSAHSKSKQSTYGGMNDLYERLLGDVSPTVLFGIYLLGTLSGIVMGVGFIFCAAN